MSDHSFTRRDFVNSMAAAGMTFHIIPRHVLGRGFRAPSDTLNVASIGAGGMGRSDVRGMAEAGQNIYALCDVDDERAADAYRSHPLAKRYKDFRELFDREAANIDAVIVSTPDHTHAAASLLAIRAGKPTRTQKPLTRTLGEVRTLAAAAREHGVATQMGNQGHANEGTRLIREWVEAGLIGTVREVHFWTNRPIWPQAIDRPLEDYHVPSTLDWDLWLGSAPERPYNPAYAPFRWRGWWDFGTGALGDMACHIMDAAFWALDLGTPTRVVPESTVLYRETAPATERITYYFDAKGDRPAVKCVWRDGSLYPPRPPEVADDALWPPDRGGGQLWIGDDGKLVADTYGRNPKLLDTERQAEVTANPLPQVYPRTDGSYAEFVTAAKGGTPAGSTFEGHGGALTEMVLLGVLAVRMGRTLELDPATGAITNVSVPPEWVTPMYRAGWSM
ncbi:MAG: Gfo/Idh/MocA family oxidoreductase [Gemmatimonadales bacterium]